MSTGAVLKSWSTGELSKGLADMYPAPGYALLFEVPDGTGGHKTRTADALAMSLWPSRGLVLHGFEIKASRSDWVKELNSPAKADAVARYCDYWSLVVGSPAIVAEGELPPTWGLIVPKGDRLKVVVQPTKLERPSAIDRSFLAAIFRRVTEKIEREDEVRVAREEGRTAGYEAGKRWGLDHSGYEAKRYRESFEGLRKAVDQFEEASGLELDAWRGGKEMGRAVKLVMEGGVERARTWMENAERAAEQIGKIAREFRKADEEALR